MADQTFNDLQNGSVPVTKLTPQPVGTGVRRPAYVTLGIPINTAISSPFQCPDHWRIDQINILASWVTANMALQTSIDNGVTWKYATTYGDLVKVYPKAGYDIILDNDFSQRISKSLIRFVSVTEASSVAAGITTVNQTTAQTLVLSLISQ